MTQSNGAYGKRAKLKFEDQGVREVAPTFGKVLHLTYSQKCRGESEVESNPERLTGHMLTLDPRVKSFTPQPFTVDLNDRRLLKTPEAVTEARKKHGQRVGRKFYTPDFAVGWKSALRSSLEVKFEGFIGDEDYQAMLRLAASILEDHGYQFARVILPADSEHPLRGNLPLMKKAANRMDLWPNDSLVRRVTEICKHQPVSLKELCTMLSLSPNLVPMLLVTGCVSGNLSSQAVIGTMQLSAAYGNLSHLELIEGFFA